MKQTFERTFITGYGIVSALGVGKEATANRLFSGCSRISEKTVSFRDKDVTSAFGVVADALPTDLNANLTLPVPDRIMQLAVPAAEEAIAQSGILNSAFDSLRAGVVIGSSQGGMTGGDTFYTTWFNEGLAAADAEPLRQYPLHAAADVIAAKFGLHGARFAVSTACSSGSNAFGLAQSLIHDGQCDFVLVGGMDSLVRSSFAGFSALGAVNPKPCQPYSNSCGINIGEGAAFFVMERECFMRQRGQSAICEFAGCGLSADAYHPTAPDPNGSGAIRSMNAALRNAGLETGAISYINGHGTGTPANDSTEKKAWKGFVGAHTEIPMVSTKGAVGHCMGAAGAIEAAFSILSLEKGIIPPTLNFAPVSEQPIDFVPNHPRRADIRAVMSNSFAFGGNNCSVLFCKNGERKRVPETETDDVVITGLGCIGVGGNTIDEFFSMLASGSSAISRFDLEGSACTVPYGGAVSLDDRIFKRYIQGSKLRRMDKITKMAMSSGRQALLDAQLPIIPAAAPRIGVIYGTGSGPSGTIRAISDSIVRIGFSGVAMDTFSNSVLNAAPGQFSIANNLKGVTSTLSTGNASGLNALIYAAMLLKCDQADAIVVLSADEWNESQHVVYEKLGLLSKTGKLPFSADADGAILTEGSVAFVLERKSFALRRRAHIYANVASYFTVSSNPALSGFDERGAVWQEGFARALRNVGVGDLDFYVSLACGDPLPVRQEIAMADSLFPNAEFFALSRSIGTPYGSVGSYGLLAAIYALKNNAAPAAGNTADIHEAYLHRFRAAAHTKEYRFAAASVASYGGAYAGVILEKA